MALVSPATLARKKFYRHTFDMKYAGSSVMLHTLLLNPDDMAQDEPARANVTETLGGAFVTDFGKGIPTVTISGTTGYRQRKTAEGRTFDGFEEFIHFRTRVYRGFIEDNDPKLSLYWYNWEDDEYYEIQPTNFRLQRNKSEPLLYRYEFKFTCLNRLKSRNQPITDYLLNSPPTRELAMEIGTAVSNISEVLNILTGRSG